MGHELTAQGGWLDVANVYLNPDPSRFDVIEVRVFDHQTRRLLTHKDGLGVSYNPSTPSFVQIRGLGQRLPNSVDVWFRASSHARGEPVVRLNGKAGSTARFARGSLSVREVHAGASSYSVKTDPLAEPTVYEWHTGPNDIDNAITVVFDRAGDPADGRYQICAVGHDGRKVFPDAPHFLNFRSRAATEAIVFRIGDTDLSHFELRPFGGRHTFYFDDVKLPRGGGRPFHDAPSVRLAVDGREVERTLSEYEPIRVTLRLRRGECCEGISSQGFSVPAGPIQRLDSAFTALLEVDGLAGDVWELTYLDREGKRVKFPAMKGLKANDGGGHSAASVFQVPLETIGTVEVRAGR